VPTLERLLAGRHSVVAVVTQPDRPRGRGRHRSASPVAEVAERAGLPVLKPERAGDPAVVEALGELRPDLGVVVAFGQFLPRRLRELPRLGFLINAHASLLPRWRGAAPIVRALLAGDRETGISVMRVEREMDAGPVALVRATSIGADETAGELEARLAALAADAIEEAVDRAAAGTLSWTEQDPTGVTWAPKLEPSERHLDVRASAEALARRVRALAPRPGAVVSLEGEPLRVLRARGSPGPVDAPPGTLRADDTRLRVATADGWLELETLQRSGRRALDAAQFLRGRPVAPGARLDPLETDE